MGDIKWPNTDPTTAVYRDCSCSFPRVDPPISQTHYFRPDSWVSNSLEDWLLLPPSPPGMALSVSVEWGRWDHHMIITSLFIVPFKKKKEKNRVLNANIIFHYYVTLNNNAILLKRDKQMQLKIRRSHNASALFGHSVILPGNICSLSTI